MCDQWPNIISKNISSPSKSHTTTNFHKEITHIQEERDVFCRPLLQNTSRSHVIINSCSPFSIIDTKHNKKKHHTTTVILFLPPHPIFNKFVIPLFKSNTKTRTGTNGCKNKFRIYMIYFHSWGLLLNCKYNRKTTDLYK